MHAQDCMETQTRGGIARHESGRKMKIRQPADDTMNDGKTQRYGVERTKYILRASEVMVVREEGSRERRQEIEHDEIEATS